MGRGWLLYSSGLPSPLACSVPSLPPDGWDGVRPRLDPANEADACLDNVPQGWEMPWLHKVLILWKCWEAQCPTELLQVLDSVPHPQPRAWEAAGLPGLGPQWGLCHCSQQASLVLNIPTSTTKGQILLSWVLEGSWTSRLTTLLGPCQPSTQHHHGPNPAILRLTERL